MFKQIESFDELEKILIQFQYTIEDNRKANNSSGWKRFKLNQKNKRFLLYYDNNIHAYYLGRNCCAAFFPEYTPGEMKNEKWIFLLEENITELFIDIESKILLCPKTEIAISL